MKPTTIQESRIKCISSAKAIAALPRVSRSRSRVSSDDVALLKPRVMSLVLFTALTGVLIAPLHVNPVIGFASLLAIAAGAGASCALNMWYDADIDALMRRTRKRPIPACIL